jgi:hypothetical protein
MYWFTRSWKDWAEVVERRDRHDRRRSGRGVVIVMMPVVEAV